MVGQLRREAAVAECQDRSFGREMQAAVGNRVVVGRLVATAAELSGHETLVAHFQNKDFGQQTQAAAGILAAAGRHVATATGLAIAVAQREPDEVVQ